MGQRGAFRVENAKAVMAPVGDVDVAVGIDRHVGGVIKNPPLGVSRRVRVRDERTQIGHGEGILRYRKCPVFADRHDELAAWGELLHAVVLPIRDIDVALVVEGDAPRLAELPLAVAAPAALGQGLAVGGEDLQAVVAAVDDIHVAAGVADPYLKSDHETHNTAAPANAFNDGDSRAYRPKRHSSYRWRHNQGS